MARRKQESPKLITTQHARVARFEAERSFWIALKGTARCANCGAAKRNIKRLGHTRFCVLPPSEKSMRLDAELGLDTRFKSAQKDTMESDEDDDLSELGDQEPAKDELLLDAEEVRAQLAMLWQNCSSSMEAALGDIYNLVGNKSMNYLRFFLDVILVAPPRFRPAQTIGQVTAEHPQNIALQRILKIKQRIADIESSISTGELVATSKSSNNASDSSDSSSDSEGQEEDENKMINNKPAAAKSNNTKKKRIDLDAKLPPEERIRKQCLQLQDAINGYYDSGKALQRGAPPGIKQILERKEGMFRKFMMGKRVNYCARSVISPDPFLSSDAIGLPIKIAQGLSYPEPVTPHNVEALRLAVENGAHNWPGANYVELKPGRRILLDRQSKESRMAMAKQLLTPPGQKVGRHLIDRDYVLVNRQPTLHRPGIMAHRVKVLRAASLADQQTIRMHYANCNAYNADFDGDEVNIHFPQNELARAEASHLAATHHNYIIPTSGKPLRGLIQDHVVAAVKLSCPGCFLDIEQFCYLLYEACRIVLGELGTIDIRIANIKPCIIKPKLMYSGKQLLAAVLNHVTKFYATNKENFFIQQFVAKAKLSPAILGGEDLEESVVLIRRGYFVRGILDKAAIGASSMGLVHAVYELYGSQAAAVLLDAYARLLTVYLRDIAGHTCGMGDLFLNQDAEEMRKKSIQASEELGLKAFDDFCTKFFADDSELPKNRNDAFELIIARGERDRLDGHMQSALAPLHSNIIKSCLPNGLAWSFEANSFTQMVATGAKGSTVNQSQICCALGQQSLEGKRVPLSATGRALPCFERYDPTPRAAGFITDRFLTGVRPPEFFFHAMAGREGLVDTAVKTSRSGYLQRCLVKHLEDLVVAYDHTVRDSEGSVIQFLYGEDGLDASSVALLSSPSQAALEFLKQNQPYHLHSNSNYDSLLAEARHSSFIEPSNEFVVYARVLARRPKVKKTKWLKSQVQREFSFGTIVKVRKSTQRYDIRFDCDSVVIKKIPIYCFADENQQNILPKAKIIKPCTERDPFSYRFPPWLQGALCQKLTDTLRKYESSAPEFIHYIEDRYARSLAAPGEAVGAIAAQSIGEPSTQMTLNTFHLAGHGAGNVTLGIPRLREIIMTAATQVKTPIIVLPYTTTQFEYPERRRCLATRLNRINLYQLFDRQFGIRGTERLSQIENKNVKPIIREYTATLRLLPIARIRHFMGISSTHDDTVKIKRGDDDKESEEDYFLDSIASTVCDKLALYLKRTLATRFARELKYEESLIERRDAARARRQRQNERKKLEEELNNDETPIAADDSDSDEDALDEADERDPEVVGARSSADKLEIQGYQDDEVEEKEEDDEEGDDDEQDNDDEEFQQQQQQIKKRAAVPKVSVTKKMLDQGRLEFCVTATVPAAEVRVPDIAMLVDEVLSQVIVREASVGVKRAVAIDDHEVDNKKIGAILVEGRDIQALWTRTDGISDGLDLDCLECNDVYAMLTTYGVEAARATIVREISAVFSIYGISVAYRHLSLVADYMTYLGGYRALNRHTMAYHSSPYLQMSFETTAAFLTSAAQAASKDFLRSPSASIVLGQPVHLGTGVFDILVPLEAEAHSTEVSSSSSPS
eukprot:CAMPEP_0197308692 /NCGR_PEP_ID=MMETSP0891-20130614/7125_1 /TAXON_ID=44058 ORGANISM="Aureoumbra lagunensis, Strain CCMP1510" /NCGR_SAMPLE_ID=MMETSP0891 /ASSEMBLY_ACC=CAM_ASM_000534 /LENGTH=1612 /DNA_ID=CAMNT_0042793255 /DNA_START=472 /DNA_END=5310 /DNA_ORIENTATION=+